jgi:hypothetical protein
VLLAPRKSPPAFERLLLGDESNHPVIDAARECKRRAAMTLARQVEAEAGALPQAGYLLLHTGPAVGLLLGAGRDRLDGRRER